MANNKASVQEQLGGAQAPAFGAQAPRVDAAAAAQPQTAGVSGQQAAPSLDFLSAVKNSRMASAMSQAGMDYVKSFKENLQNSDSGKNEVKVYNLPYPANALAAVAHNKAIVLIFSEAVRQKEDLPTVAQARNSLNGLRALAGNNVLVIDTIVVTPADYQKPSVMAAHVYNALLANASDEFASLCVASLKKSQLDVSTVPAVWENFMAATDPHGVLPRADLTMTFSVGKQGRQSELLFDQAENEEFPFAAVSAFVNFSRTLVNGQQKFLPEIHISNISSLILHQNIIPMLISEAASVLLDNQYWKAQFVEMARTEWPNIGNLIVDTENGETWSCQNLQQRDEFIANYCAAPILVLDIEEGRAKIPGLEKYADPAWNGEIVNTFNRFLVGSNVSLSTAAVVAEPFFTTYEGEVTTVGNTAADTRYIDFLNQMIHKKTMRGECEILLAHYSTPEEDIANKRRFEQSINLHYVNYQVVLVPDVIRAALNAIVSTVGNINGNRITGTVDLSRFMNMGQRWGQAAYGSTQQGMYGAVNNQFSTLYGPQGIQGSLF